MKILRGGTQIRRDRNNWGGRERIYGKEVGRRVRVKGKSGFVTGNSGNIDRKYQFNGELSENDRMG